MQPAMPGRRPLPAGDHRRPDRENLLLAAHGRFLRLASVLLPTAKTWHSGCTRAIVFRVK
jgi:hypothetical protein